MLQSELDQCGCIRSVLWYNALISSSHLALTLNRLVAAQVIKLKMSYCHIAAAAP